MAKRSRIAVVGSANIDLTTFTDRFPKPGETCFGQKFDLGFGGKGANQAVAAHLCGADVFMVALEATFSARLQLRTSRRLGSTQLT
jgi:ribokinase